MVKATYKMRIQKTDMKKYTNLIEQKHNYKIIILKLHDL